MFVQQPIAFALAALMSAAVLAGCAGTRDVETTTTVTQDATPTKEPAPKGSALTRAEIALLVGAFDDQPFTGGQGTPAHVWKWVSDNTFIGLHFNNDDVLQATKLHWIVVGQKGVFCKESQPGGADGGFTHFHKYSSPTWDSGHGSSTPGDQGYWLLHLAVDSFTAPWGAVSPGVDYNFMPTAPLACVAPLPTPTFTPAGAGEVTAAENLKLNSVFDDNPYSGGQETDMHVWKWVNDNAFIFLHWNKDEPLDADKLLWFGTGVRGEMCKASQPHADYTHFHKWSAPSWAAGHGGAARDTGYWLLHAAVRPLTTAEVPWAPVEVGVDRDFMPTPPPTC